MKTRRILAVLLALVLALGTTTLTAMAFTDVAEDAYYADAVAWAADKNITTGYEDDTFRPDRAVSRAEAVTFLWRMAGEPAPAKTETFADVEADPNNRWYQTAVQWAVAEGITNGTGNGFDPYVTCSRGMILTMLYRLEGEPLAEAMAAEIPENEEAQSLESFGYSLIQELVNGIRSGNAIPDVKEGDWYELPIIWAELMGILREDQVDAETGAAHPTADCPRGEMVTFLYRDSGDAPVEGAVETGTIPETVLFDAGGVKITATGIRPEGLTDAIVDCTVVNGSEKTLRVDASELYVNTYAISPQVCIPTESEDGFTFYADAVIAPGQTQDIELRLNSLDDRRIDAIHEMELAISLSEVEKDEDGWYSFADEFAVGDVVRIRTSLYDGDASYDLEGTVLIEADGLKVLLLQAENREYSGPTITLYVYNGGSEDVQLELAELKLDGETKDGFFGMDNLPAGKRAVTEVSTFIEDYDNIPVVKEAELTLRTVDPETWEPRAVFDPVKVTFAQ